MNTTCAHAGTDSYLFEELILRNKPSKRTEFNELKGYLVHHGMGDGVRVEEQTKGVLQPPEPDAQRWKYDTTTFD